MELEPYVGERVTVRGVPVPGPVDPSRPQLFYAVEVEQADSPGGEETAVAAFELTVEGEPPANATFFDFIPAEGENGRLPNTGGGWAVLLLVGAALIGGGWLLVRRFSTSG